MDVEVRDGMALGTFVKTSCPLNVVLYLKDKPSNQCLNAFLASAHPKIRTIEFYPISCLELWDCNGTRLVLPSSVELLQTYWGGTTEDRPDWATEPCSRRISEDEVVEWLDGIASGMEVGHTLRVQIGRGKDTDIRQIRG